MLNNSPVSEAVQCQYPGLFLNKYFIEVLGTHFKRQNAGVISFLVLCSSVGKILQEETQAGRDCLGVPLPLSGIVCALGSRAPLVVGVLHHPRQGWASCGQQTDPSPPAVLYIKFY